jgi:hypothetical protein
MAIEKLRVVDVRPTFVAFQAVTGHRIVGLVSNVKQTEAGLYLRVVELFFYMKDSNISWVDRGSVHFVAVDEESLGLATDTEKETEAQKCR